ncbi:MAG: ABC transporter ATP-binding protein [Clostridiales bacterium]|nr:ABC transporter ATP-binding protein [Clostridiales bacterium]
MDTIIEVKNVGKTFGKNTTLNRVLDGCDLRVSKGEFVSLMGASGSGKSTLLYLIGGLDRDFEGNIELCGKDIGSLKDRELSDLRLKNIGFVFQFYNLVMNLNVEDNIMLPSTINGKKRSEIKKHLDEILEITGLTEKRKAMPATLSGGQQQRVAIARAILGEPSVILADEPTGNLDSNSSREIMELFGRLNKEKGLTILQVTHSSECASYGTRIIRLENGKAVE